ncbi:serum paraoxonase/arylesterase 2-like [Apostichopus japonicus]|uniref:serum paraoxonase/arylesterase 2-like n=1 Tax=Stichopus japonicus TaxID=307972 RepID=UPI003AB4E6CD
MLLKILCGILVAIVCRQILFFVDVFGIYVTVRTHWPGPCRNVEPVVTGSENIAVTKDGLAFITSGLVPQYRRETVDPRMRRTFQGKIYLFDFNTPEKDAQDLKIDREIDFMPHGISLLEDESTGEIKLFVVNHREHHDTIEVMVYDQHEMTLHHVTTITDPLFTSLNDVVADGPNSFYVTNDGYFRNSSLRTPERLLTLPWGSVLYFNDKSTHVVVPRAYEPNGIAISNDKSMVFVNMPFLKSIYVYKRNTDDSLDLVHNLNVNISFDNVYVHPVTGHLWLGALAIPHKVATAAANIDHIAPAVACRLEPRGPPTDVFQSFHLYEVFADSTGLLSTSSCVVEYNGKLLVGSIFHKLVYCLMETKY